MLQQTTKNNSTKSHSLFSFCCDTKNGSVKDGNKIYSIFAVIKKQGDDQKKSAKQNEQVQERYFKKKHKNNRSAQASPNILKNEKPLNQNPIKSNKKEIKSKSNRQIQMVFRPKNQSESRKKGSGHKRKLTTSLKPKLSDDKSKEKDFKNEVHEVVLDSAMEYYGDDSNNKRQTIKTAISEESKVKGSIKSDINLKKKLSLPSDQYNDVQVISPRTSMKGLDDSVSGYFHRIIAMNEKHSEEVKRATHLNQKQMRRLLKIHEIEKEKLKQQINTFINEIR